MSVPNESFDRVNDQREEDEITRLIQNNNTKRAWEIVAAYSGERRMELIRLFNSIFDAMDDPNVRHLPPKRDKPVFPDPF